MNKFLDESDSNSSRFLQHVKRTYVYNFAAQNMKKVNVPASQKAKTNAESPRDMFVCMIVIIAEKTQFDIWNDLAYLIKYSHCHAHTVMDHVKTEKSALLKK